MSSGIEADEVLIKAFLWDTPYPPDARIRAVELFLHAIKHVYVPNQQQIEKLRQAWNKEIADYNKQIAAWIRMDEDSILSTFEIDAEDNEINTKDTRGLRQSYKVPNNSDPLYTPYRKANSRQRHAGKTVRYPSWYRDYTTNPKISAHHPIEYLDSRSIAIGRTAVNSMISATYGNKLALDNIRCYGNKLQTVLGHNASWEYLLEYLEAGALSRVVLPKQVTRSSFHAERTIEYKFPVKYEQIVQISGESKLQVCEFMWRGKKYNSNMLYIGLALIQNYIPLGFSTTVNIPEGTKQLPVMQRITPSNIRVRCLPTWQQQDLKNRRANIGLAPKNIVLDTGKNHIIEYIAVKGAPFHIDRISYNYNHVDIPHNHTLQLVYESTNGYYYDSCVQTFTLEYRQHSSRQWILLGDFTGNSDRITEVLIKLDIPIVAQYLRITPLTYKGLPKMCIRVFGSNPRSSNLQTDLSKSRSVDLSSYATYRVEYPADHTYYPDRIKKSTYGRRHDVDAKCEWLPKSRCKLRSQITSLVKKPHGDLWFDDFTNGKVAAKDDVRKEIAKDDAEFISDDFLGYTRADLYKVKMAIDGTEYYTVEESPNSEWYWESNPYWESVWYEESDWYYESDWNYESD